MFKKFQIVRKNRTAQNARQKSHGKKRTAKIARHKTHGIKRTAQNARVNGRPYPPIHSSCLESNRQWIPF
jgi:hypothetical protein